MSDQETETFPPPDAYKGRIQSNGLFKKTARKLVRGVTQKFFKKKPNEPHKEANLFDIVYVYSKLLQDLQDKDFSKETAEYEIRAAFETAARENTSVTRTDYINFAFSCLAGGLSGLYGGASLATSLTADMPVARCINAAVIVAAAGAAVAFIALPEYRARKFCPPLLISQFDEKVHFDPMAKGSAVVAEKTIDSLVEKYGTYGLKWIDPLTNKERLPYPLLNVSSNGTKGADFSPIADSSPIKGTRNPVFLAALIL